MGALETRTAGSRLAIILTTVIVTTVVLAGGVALATVGFNSVGSPEIKNGSIRSVDIATGGVKTVDILDGTVGSADLKNDTVRSLDIRDGTITSADIADGEVRTQDINDGAVRTQDINDGAVRSSDINDGAVKPVDLAAKAQPAGVAFADGDQALVLGGSAESVRSVVLDAPAPGHVIVTASAYTMLESSGFDQVACSITDGAIAIDIAHTIVVNDSGITASEQAIPLSGTRTFAVPAGPTTLRLVCDENLDSVITIVDSQITALYVPQLYAP